MKRYIFLAGAMTLVPAAAFAQTATPAPATAPATAAKTPAVGATIMDSAGVSIGTVDTITPQAVVINTGTTKVAVPPTSIGATAKGFALSITKAELDAASAQQQQAAAASIQSRLVAGTSVNGLNGAVLGTIKANDGTNVTLTTPNGEAKLPMTGFAPGPNNTVVVGLTAEQLRTAMGASGTASASGTAATPAPATEAIAPATPAAPAAGTMTPTTESTTMTAPTAAATPATDVTPAATATTTSSTKVKMKKTTTKR